MFDFQDQIMFPTHAVAAPGPLPAGRDAASNSGAGRKRAAWRPHPAGASCRDERTLILGFGGNALERRRTSADYLHNVYPDADVVAFHYRGYRPSTGSPSAEALLADAPLVYDFAVARVHAGPDDRRRLQHRQRGRRAASRASASSTG